MQRMLTFCVLLLSYCFAQRLDTLEILESQV